MNTFDVMSDLSHYLSSGERVLWEGRSRHRTGATWNAGVIFVGIFVAVAILVFVIVAAVASSRGLDADDRVVGLLIMPIIFLAVGLGIGIPLIVMGRRYGDSRYVVTSSAAMIVIPGGWGGKQVQVVPLRNVSLISLVENRDGTGTLTFGQNPMWAYGARYSGARWMGGAGSVPAFWNIERPAEVYQLIRRQMNEA